MNNGDKFNFLKDDETGGIFKYEKGKTKKMEVVDMTVDYDRCFAWKTNFCMVRNNLWGLEE